MKLMLCASGEAFPYCGARRFSTVRLLSPMAKRYHFFHGIHDLINATSEISALIDAKAATLAEIAEKRKKLLQDHVK